MAQFVPPPRKRTEELYDLAAKTFSHNGYFSFLEYCRKCYWPGSSYDWEASRVAIEDDKIVAHVGVWTYSARVGAARLKTGGIGAVLTHADYRKRGLCAGAFKACIPAMRNAGYDLTTLFGISNFYHQFGYCQGWPDNRCVVELSAVPEGKLTLRTKKVPLQEVQCGRGEIMRIYQRENAPFVGTNDRSVPMYTRVAGGRAKNNCTALLRGEKIVGYVVWRADTEHLSVIEVGGLGKDCGVDQIVQAIRRLAVKNKRTRIVLLHMPYTHPLIELMRLGNCRIEMTHTRSGAAMAREVSLRSCLDKMLPELSTRLRETTLAGYRGELVIATAEETVGLAVNRGKVALAEKPSGRSRIAAGTQAARLILGSEEPTTLQLQGMAFTGDALKLAGTLFPKRWPTLYGLDMF